MHGLHLFCHSVCDTKPTKLLLLKPAFLSSCRRVVVTNAGLACKPGVGGEEKNPEDEAAQF